MNTHGWNQVSLGGLDQWVSVRGDRGSPVLLWLHGGPGGSEYGARRHYLRGLEQGWLVVEWEQRGAGRSFRGDETASTLNLDQLVADTVELVEVLCRELGRERIVLCGHSFGTVLGVLAAARVPHRIAAWVGSAQVVDWSLQEERSYRWALDEAKRQGKREVVLALERIGAPREGIYASGRAGTETQRRHLGALGGVSQPPSFLLRWMLSLVLAPDYPLRAKFRLTQGMARSMDLLWPELGRRVDFLQNVRKLEVPVHVFQGDADRITDPAQVKDWLETLEAPSKRLEIVPGAAHLAPFEQPQRFERFLEIVRAQTLESAPPRETSG